MKYKNLVLGCLILSVVLLSVLLVRLYSSQKDQLAQIFSDSVETIIEYGKEPSRDFEYIAIDFDSLKGLEQPEKEALRVYFEAKYHVPVLDASYLELLDQGIENRSEEISGLIVYVEKIENQIFSYNVHIAKEYGSLGANSIIVKFHLKEGVWKIWKVKLNWVA